MAVTLHADGATAEQTATGEAEGDPNLDARPQCHAGAKARANARPYKKSLEVPQ
jgi:hypothetical protein